MTAFEALRGRVDAIVVGASSGGIEALMAILPALPRDSHMVVIVVLHLPREGPSLLVDIFRPKCAVRVCEANDKQPAVGGHIYFAPPDYHLLVDAGPQLALSVDEPVHYSRPSIDVLFESAADVYGDRLLAIVLTGANHDGAAGLMAVKRAGGTTVVQDPSEARMPMMPSAALEAQHPDFVLTTEAIAGMVRALHAGVKA